MIPTQFEIMKENMIDIMNEIQEIYKSIDDLVSKSKEHIELLKTFKNPSYMNMLIATTANETLDYLNPILDRIELLDSIYHKMSIKVIKEGGVINIQNNVEIFNIISNLVDIKLEMKEMLR
jgi:hypothetical protein